jgi:hypothetical protein
MATTSLSSKSTLRSFLKRSMKSSQVLFVSFFHVKHFYIVFCMIPIDLTLCGSTIVAYMEEHLMINNSNLVCMMTLTLKSDREGKCLLFYHTFARMTFLLASLLNSLTIIVFSPGRSEGKRCMATTSLF